MDEYEMRAFSSPLARQKVSTEDLMARDADAVSLSDAIVSPNLSTEDITVQGPSFSSPSDRFYASTRSQKSISTQFHVEVEELELLSTTSDPWLRTSLQPRLSGWKVGLSLGIAIDFAVLLTTLAFTLISATRFQRDGSLAVLIENDCARTRSWTIWLHFVINVFSSALLATSSYAMQCLAAPTRKDVDMAHRDGKAMSIGVPSVRNLTKIERRRTILYALAVLSSLPIHLLANSAVFDTIGTDSYVMAVAYERFLQKSASDLQNSQWLWPISPFNYNDSMGNSITVYNAQFILSSIATNLTRLENSECIRQYSRPLVSGRRHVIAVTPGSPPANTSISLGKTSPGLETQIWYQSINVCPDCPSLFQTWADPSLWTCAFLAGEKLSLVNECDGSNAASKAANFSISGHPISHCLSEEIEEKCLLQADIIVLSVVIVCALIKLVVLVAATNLIPSETLNTIGDAVASFLNNPDVTTRQGCLINNADVERKRSSQKWSLARRIITQPQYARARHWSMQGSRLDWWVPGAPFVKRWSSLSLQSTYHHAFSRGHWLCLFVLYFLGLLVAGGSLAIGVERLKQSNGPVGHTPSSLRAIWKFGFGNVNPNFIMPLPDIANTASRKTIEHALVVNAPQLFLSITYFFYNSAWTQMLIAREWASYGRRRQGLRVSRPQSIHQRRSYFLTIPYRFAIPILVCSALLHWLISQSLFLARIDVYSGKPFVRYPEVTYNTVGYSLIGLIFSIILWTFMFAILFAAGLLWKLGSPIPIVGGCSVAISAACHPPDCEKRNNRDPGLQRVMWGVTPDEIVASPEFGNDDGKEIIRHCSFSAGEVYSPETLPQQRLSTKGVSYTVFFFK